MRVKLPPALKKGGTIGIVAPGSWVAAPVLEQGKNVLETLGYRVVVHPQNFARAGQLAGDDGTRAQALMDVFLDPSIDAVMCARGGYGSNRLLDHLDFIKIGRTPKPFIGYSDITILLQAMALKSGFTTFHGPMLVSLLSANFNPRAGAECFEVLGQEALFFEREPSGVQCVRPGLAEGQLVGGNMTQLDNLIATPFDASWENKILFIEDVDEVLYRIDRLMQHYRLTGKLAKVRGIIVGEMIDVPDGETSYMRPGEQPLGRTLAQIMLDAAPPNIPICLNFPCGHGRSNMTLPIGAPATLTLDQASCKLRFELKDS